jgi:hypothetical protein
MITGAGQIAAGLGLLFSVLPKIAATIEAIMITLFTVLCWAPAIAAAPKERMPWTGLLRQLDIWKRRVDRSAKHTARPGPCTESQS